MEQITNLTTECSLGSDASIGGTSVTFSGAGKYGDYSLTGVNCVLRILRAPEATSVKIAQTRALDGRQEEHWGVWSASWTFHPDDGLNMVIEIDEEPAG